MTQSNNEPKDEREFRDGRTLGEMMADGDFQLTSDGATFVVPAQEPEPVEPPFNSMAITALVTGVISLVFGLVSPLAIWFGIKALKQIEQTSERGKPLAIAGIVLGGIMLTLIVVLLVLVAIANLA